MPIIDYYDQTGFNRFNIRNVFVTRVCYTARVNVETAISFEGKFHRIVPHSYNDDLYSFKFDLPKRHAKILSYIIGFNDLKFNDVRSMNDCHFDGEDRQIALIANVANIRGRSWIGEYRG